MKQILFLLALVLSPLHAADPQPTFTYQGEVAGVVCAACSGIVKTALSKLDGVTNVKITAGKEGESPKLTVTSTSPSLTREAAVAALGEESKFYDIRSFKLQQK